MSPTYVLGIDQGSSGSRALLLDDEGQACGYGYQPVGRLHPQPGWVEQEPYAIAASVRAAIEQALGHAGCAASQVVACGITSQRDTVFAWDTATGQPIGNAITWQDLRTVDLVAETGSWAQAAERRARLGQFPGPYCSAMHMAWRMRHDVAFRRAAHEGRLRCSLAPGWLLQALGRPSGHVLDYSLFQAMTVFDFRRRQIWEEWVAHLDIPRAALPGPVPTLHHFGELEIADAHGGRAAVPVLAMIADQQGALFGYDCRTPGAAACTHGTGSYVNVAAGAAIPPMPPDSMAKIYLAWELEGVPTYAIEADTTVTGAVVRWMQEQMGWLRSPADLDTLARTVPDAAGVLFVPAFIGLGMPYEDRGARGTLLGMTLDTTPAHIARAFLEALGCLVYEMLEVVRREAGITVERLHVGGGLSSSDAACQAQADVLGVPVVRVQNAETTVRAAALLAGLGANIWPSAADLPPLPGDATTFEPQRDAATRAAGLEAWSRAIERARGWA